MSADGRPARNIASELVRAAEVETAVAPADGTNAAANSLPGAVAIVALSERGRAFDLGPALLRSAELDQTSPQPFQLIRNS